MASNRIDSPPRKGRDSPVIDSAAGPKTSAGEFDSNFATPHAFVDYDNFAFAYAATRRLIAKGRRKVTIVLPPRRLTFYQHMLHGFMTAVREAGVAYEIPDALDLDSPADMIRDYVRRRSTEPDPPDGFACPGEVSALIALLLAFVATLYPSWRASRVNPAEALRYE